MLLRRRKKNTPNAVKPMVKRTTAILRVANTQRHPSSVMSLSCSKLALKLLTDIGLVLYGLRS